MERQRSPNEELLLRKTSDAVEDLSKKINHMEEMLMKIHNSSFTNGSLLTDLQQLIISRDSAPTSSANLNGSIRPILRKNVRTEDEVELIPVLAAPPRPMSVLPGEVKEETNSELMTPRVSRNISAKTRPRGSPRGSMKAGFRHASTMDQLSTLVARDLLVSNQRSHRSGNSTPKESPSIAEVTEDPETDELGENTPSQSEEKRSASRSSKNLAVLEKTQKISLDELRTNHDAQARAISASGTNSELERWVAEGSSMPWTAQFWLVMTGVLDFPSVACSQLWRFALILVALAMSISLIWFSIQESANADVAATTICYMLGVAVSIWILRRREVQELMGSHESSLDMYARKSGFIREWRKKSRKRLLEALGFLLLMCALRGLVHSQPSTSESYEAIVTAAFCCNAMAFVAIAYLQLHILSGLELAIDSFTINFFRVMSFEDAVGEWNVVQATLRHVSSKLSRPLFALGISCGASLLYLIELSFLNDDIPGGPAFILRNLWPLPPLILFLYTMMRAAAVTEKASRVPPLVNSWNFDGSELEDFPGWMDLGRQYVVQYIIQSEAGFYMQGVRLSIFQVTKLCYYFGAFLFAVFTRMTG